MKLLSILFPYNTTGRNGRVEFCRYSFTRHRWLIGYAKTRREAREIALK